MTPLSPLDALGPAFRRTGEVLARPFRLGFFLKIALIAALTQPSFYSASISYPMQGVQFGVMSRLPHRAPYGVQFLSAPHFAAIGAAVLVVMCVIGLVVWVVASYIYCRLRFTLFDLVVYKRGRVGQSWSAYGRQTWRYFGMLILASLAFMVVAAVLVGPTLLNFIRVVRPMAAAGPNMNPFAMLGAMFPFLGAIFLVVAMWAVIDALMQDFLLPPLAIEDAPLERAFGRFFALLRTSFGTVALYVLLRFAVGLGITWILLMVFMLVLLLVGLGVFGVGLLLYHALWISLPGQVVLVSIGIVVGLVALAVYLIGIVSIYGTAAVFKQSYSAYFFGGRYPDLGSRLEPLMDAVTAAPQPESPSSPSLPPLSNAPPVW